MKKLTILLVCIYCLCSCSEAQVAPNKIPIDGARWYQLNNTTTGLQGLFDNNLTTVLNTGWGTVLSRYESWYRLLDGEQMTIDSIRMYDGQGTYTSTPMYLYTVNEKFERALIATFTGEKWNTWVGPDPTKPLQYALSTPATGFRYLVISSTTTSFPAEIEFLGTYKAPNANLVAAQPRQVKLGGEFGINAFEWNFEDPTKPLVIDEARMAAVKTFTGVRHYLDWKRLEATEGNYTFNPSHTGSFNYDAIYQRCQQEGIEVLACLKTVPEWMLATWPDTERNEENVPLRYGKPYDDPKSYIEQAKLGFQFAARYGSNKNVDPKLVTVNTATRWTNDPANQVKIGLGYITYIECENERDKSWKGRKAYQTGREYAANLSAFYDGHKNSMGPGVGVKNADPNMKVVMAGLAGAKTDYVMGMIDWCREFRGYKADGSVDLCWDVINYHYYANDGQQSQAGTSTRGVAPEVSTGARVAAEFINAARMYTGDMPVWITETGYDLNQGSPYKAIPIGDKTEVETQADWILRTALMAARNGIEKVFFYQMYDNNAASSGKFNSMGLINSDKTRKPAGDYLLQANKLMGAYTYRETINTDPVVDRYDLDGNSAWVLVVPDEKGRTATYKLTTGTSTVRVFRPTIGADAMTEEVLNTTNGSIELTVTETPLFVLPGENKTASLADAGAIAGPATVCVNTPAQYSVTPVTGATGYDWTVPAGWQIQSGTNSYTISVVAGSAGGEVSVRPFNAEDSSAVSILAVTTATVPTLAAITGPAEACENTVADYSTGSIGGTNYTWAAAGTGWALNSANGTNAIKVSIGTGAGSISVIGTNGCGSSTAVVLSLKTQSAVVSVGLILGNDAACEGSTQTYNISPVANASSYAWSVPSGWSVTSGQGSTTVKVVVGSNSGSIAVAASNACSNASAQKNIQASAAVVQIASNAGSSASRDLASGCTYAVAGTEFDAVATSSCGGTVATSWQISGATTGSGSGSLAGVSLKQGLTTITWKAVSSGGETTAQTQVTVSDGIAPTVTVPANISQSWNGKKCSGSLTVPDPGISDNCTVVLVTWTMTGASTAKSPSSGINYVGTQTFNVGVTYISYTAVDAAGNKTTAQFTVSISNPKCGGTNTTRGNNKRMAESLLTLTAYPNPSQNYFNIRMEGSGGAPIDIRVIDMLGRVIEVRKSITPGTVIQFGQNLRAGWYILEAVQGEEKQQVKLIKGEQRG